MKTEEEKSLKEEEKKMKTEEEKPVKEEEKKKMKRLKEKGKKKMKTEEEKSLKEDEKKKMKTEEEEPVKEEEKKKMKPLKEEGKKNKKKRFGEQNLAVMVGIDKDYKFQINLEKFKKYLVDKSYIIYSCFECRQFSSKDSIKVADHVRDTHPEKYEELFQIYKQTGTLP